MGMTLMWRWWACGSQQGAQTSLSQSHLQAQLCAARRSRCRHLPQGQLQQDRQRQQQQQQQHTCHRRQQCTQHQRQQQRLLRQHNFDELMGQTARQLQLLQQLLLRRRPKLGCWTLDGHLEGIQGCQQVQVQLPQGYTCTCRVRQLATQLQVLPSQAMASRVTICTVLVPCSTGPVPMSQGSLSLRLTDASLG
jgi:hypothetical protein